MSNTPGSKHSLKKNIWSGSILSEIYVRPNKNRILIPFNNRIRNYDAIVKGTDAQYLSSQARNARGHLLTLMFPPPPKHSNNKTEKWRTNFFFFLNNPNHTYLNNLILMYLDLDYFKKMSRIRILLRIPKFTANLYCIWLCIPQIYVLKQMQYILAVNSAKIIMKRWTK